MKIHRVFGVVAALPGAALIIQGAHSMGGWILMLGGLAILGADALAQDQDVTASSEDDWINWW